MKRILLFTLIVALSLPIFGASIDETTAKQLAQNFWKENNIMGVKGDKVFKKRMDDARFVNVAYLCGYSEFFIFNNEDGKGFVIIAADDCVTPILGYSYDNNFAAENLPPNLKDWLDGYAEQIRMAVEMKVTATDEIRADWECLRQGKNLPIRSETAVNPLLSTAWGQGDYYNAQCPSLLGTHTPTGCVATAMAQIMKYWNYPTHGYNYHSYYCWPYGVQSANFAGTEYQWSSMPNIVTSPNNAVATLMYHCGVSVEMNYGIINGSGASIVYDDYGGYNTFCAENALKDYFGYSSSLQGKKKNDYSEAAWINMLKTELNNLKPILYGGQGTGGHAFVCDGYDTNNRFSFNWGWDGTANNGWFYINNLNPNNENYSNYQRAVIGIQPDNDLQNYNLVLYDNVQMVGDVFGNYDFGQSISAYAEILNNGNSTFSGYIAAAVFDNDGYFIDFLGGGYTSLEPNYSTSDIVEHEGGIPFLPSYEYLYHTVMLYSTNGENWTIINSGNYSNDGIFQVLNNGEDIIANSEFIISTGEDILFNGQTATINIDVINEGSTTYYGSIWLCLTNYDTNSSQTIGIIDIDDGLPVNYHFTNGLDFTNTIILPEGQYYLELLYIKDDHLHYAGSVIYPCIKRVYVSNYPYSINATANPSDGGSITGLGDYFEGETCTLTAIANNGYTFINWTENGTQVSTNATYSFMVTGNRNLVANFQTQLQQYTISVSANPSNGGTTTCNKTMIAENFENYTVGTKIATAALAAGHDYWTTWHNSPGSSEDGYVENLNDNRCGHFTYGNDQILLLNNVTNGVYDLKFDIIVPQGKNGYFNLLHHFDDSNSIWAMQCYLHLTNDGETSISAPGHGTVHAGSNSTADLPCVYDQWMHFRIHIDTDNDVAQLYFNVLGQPESLYAEWQWSLDSFGTNTTDYLLEAINFFPPENTESEFYVDNIVVNKQTNIFNHGDICTLTATPNSSYAFVNWTEDGTQVSTNANYTFTVTGNRNLVANFQAQPQQYTINVSASPTNGGSVTGGGTYQQGQTCTVSATANSGYNFINWTENGTQVSTNANYTFTVTSNRNLIAHFTTQNYVITALADPTAGGTVTGSGGYNYGESCTLTATANAGYTFINWTKNGTQVSSNPTYTFTVTETATYVAHFSIQNCTVTTSSSPSNGGTTTGGGTYNYGQTCTVTASAANGYAFTNWTENGTQVSTNANYSFTVTSNRNLVANFAQNAHTIHATAGANGIITPSGTITVAHGANQSFAMIPNEGYEIQDVYIDGNSVGPMTSYTFTNVTADHYIHVTFVHVDGIEESNNISTVVYPNPTTGIVNIKCDEVVQINVFDTFGQLLTSQNSNGNDHKIIDISNFPNGLYLIQLISPKGMSTKQIIKIQ